LRGETSSIVREAAGNDGEAHDSCTELTTQVTPNFDRTRLEQERLLRRKDRGALLPALHRGAEAPGVVKEVCPRTPGANWGVPDTPGANYFPDLNTSDLNVHPPNPNARKLATVRRARGTETKSRKTRTHANSRRFAETKLFPHECSSEGCAPENPPRVAAGGGGGRHASRGR